jgi:hypothetical protein
LLQAVGCQRLSNASPGATCSQGIVWLGVAATLVAGLLVAKPVGNAYRKLWKWGETETSKNDFEES